MMKYLLIWAAYEFIRPKAIWLFNYLVSRGQR